MDGGGSTGVAAWKRVMLELRKSRQATGRILLRGNTGRASTRLIAGLAVSCKLDGDYGKKMEQTEQMVQGGPALRVESMEKEDVTPPGFEMVPRLELGCNSQGGSMVVMEDSDLVHSLSPGGPMGVVGPPLPLGN
ncbi:hypothetical protein NDU88_001086 [Pleurodeles waltl]|uniref:Uncharacterized protein n=1 Tax=Pleurodeles waltl TaxID=8319 RepID=A0AAV7L8R9_PLEWA|nr:hypothetical protein NDU88_001086 [Pleurodeles waltl]